MPQSLDDNYSPGDGTFDTLGEGETNPTDSAAAMMTDLIISSPNYARFRDGTAGRLIPASRSEQFVSVNSICLKNRTET
jgi:hypothetical protein